MKTLIFGTLCLALTGCVTVTRTVFYQMNEVDRVSSKSLKRMLWENEISREESILTSQILRGDLASYHLIQLPAAEKNHMHEFHDLAVFVQSGSGTMFLGNESFKAGSGSVIFIPHGTWHAFVNSGPEPAVAIAVYSPGFDGKDIRYEEER